MPSSASVSGSPSNPARGGERGFGSESDVFLDTRDGVEIDSTEGNAAAYDERVHDTLISDAGFDHWANLNLSVGREPTSTMGAHKVFDGKSERQGETSSHVLHVTITCVLYALTENVIHQVFDPYGVNEICVLQESTHVKALVEFQSWREARDARGGLQGRCIYDGCCFLDIQHAPPSIGIHRLPNSEPVVVDWDRVEVEPLTSSSSWAGQVVGAGGSHADAAFTSAMPTSCSEEGLAHYTDSGHAEIVFAASGSTLIPVATSILARDVDSDISAELLTHVGGLPPFQELELGHDSPDTDVVWDEELANCVVTQIGRYSLFLEPCVESARVVFSEPHQMECEDDVFTIIGGLSLFLEQVVQSTEESEAICSMKMGYDECIADHVLSYVGGMSLFLEEGLSSSDEMFQAVFACHTFSFAMVDVSAEDTVFQFLPPWRHGGFSPGATISVSKILQHCSSRDHLSVHWEFAGLQPLRGSLAVVLNCTSLWPTEEMDRLSIPWDPGGSRFACWLLDTKHFATYIVVSFMNQLLHLYVWENGKSAVHAIELYVQWGPGLIENVLMVAMFVQLAQKSVDLPVLYIQVIKELCDYTIAGNNTGYSMHNLLMDSIVWLGGHGLVAELGGVWKITNNGVTYWSSAVQLPLWLKLEMHATLNMDTRQTWNQMGSSTVYHCWPLGSSSNERNNMYWHLQVQEEPCNCRNLCSFIGVSKYLKYKQWDPGIGQQDLECFMKQYQHILAAKFQGCSEYICAALLPTVSTSYKCRHYGSFSASGYYVQYKQEIEAFMESTFMHCLGTSNVSWGRYCHTRYLGVMGLGFMGRLYLDANKRSSHAWKEGIEEQN